MTGETVELTEIEIPTAEGFVLRGHLSLRPIGPAILPGDVECSYPEAAPS